MNGRKMEMKIKNIVIILLLIFLISAVIKGEEKEDELKQANTFVTQYILGCRDCINKAIEIYNSVIVDNETNTKTISNAKTGLAKAYYAKKEYKKAVELFESVLKSNELTIGEQEKIMYQVGYIKYILEYMSGKTRQFIGDTPVIILQEKNSIYLYQTLNSYSRIGMSANMIGMEALLIVRQKLYMIINIQAKP